MATAQETPSEVPGRHLPDEILEGIFKFVLEDDNTAYILPFTTAAIAPPPLRAPTTTRRRRRKRNHRQSEAKHNPPYYAITSVNTRMRTSKHYQKIYYHLFRKKTFKLEITNLVVIVQNFNFDPFLDDLAAGIFKRSTRIQEEFLEWQYNIQLVFTDDFLRQPYPDNMDRFLNRIHDDDWDVESSYSFGYAVDPIPREYIEGFIQCINTLVLIRRGVAGDELTQFMTDVKRKSDDGAIYK